MQQENFDQVNLLIKEAEPFVLAYWEQIRYVWSTGKMQVCKEELPFAKSPELKRLNKQYKLLLKSK